MSDPNGMLNVMDEERLICARTALATIPERYRGITESDIVAQENGHSFYHGLHAGWVWGVEDSGRIFLDLLWEHRMTNMRVRRFFPDGTKEWLEAPDEFFIGSNDPEEHAERERQFVERNKRIYAELRQRGLLPAFGGNITSQDMNELLRSRGEHDNE